MRNDAHDEFDDVPSLTPDRRDQDDFDPEPQPYARAAAPGKAAVAPRAASTGPLWALVGALSIALGAVGWWSFQQINLMEQQLVATQESFARISEEAAGRIQDISGKVVAAESNVTTGSEALRLQVRQLEGKVAELTKQQQAAGGQQSGQDKRIEQLIADLKAQQGDTGKYDESLKTLGSEQGSLKSELAAVKSELATLKSAQADAGKLTTQVRSLAGDIEALKKAGNSNAAVDRLEQDLLVLKSQMDNRPAASSGSSTAEFDAFRAQTTRSVNTLQAQIQNLQQQIDAR
ncbi:chromosome segregation ATPase [Pseudomonas sp. BIGb0408]|uniref:Chromosome segregation ATPase n=1 Tax=Phytopseudomonas flavescens TaxID=29435 RepID=A0A7Z0BP30_9GAMM|nr:MULTISPECIES: ATPase [Pseudomonas]MCW2291172.1 chromosome segregation ATPase [Pseudomonas sp. BIGb0408]NYH74257.1 chromosome segregation ATPase [Pseudomonas flavescens]